MENIKIPTNWLFILVSVLILHSCRNVSPVEEERKLRMVYTEWTESVALTYLSTVLLEEQMDYDVELKLTDIENVYREVAEGKADIFTDAWLPETHQQYFEKFREKLELIGIIYPDAKIGFVVPEYSTLKKVADLKNYSHTLIGIDEGAGVMQKARIAIEKYDLSNTLSDLSEEEMVQHFEDSIKRRKDIVVTGWEPHWIFARYDVRFLEDPDNVFGKRENIYSIGHTGIEQEHPHVIRFFERMQLTEKQLNRLVYHVQLSEDPREGIKTWIKEHEYIVNQWVKNLKPERKKIM
jgi:glycine betaine/proline transport system substrate-binding protein